MLLVDSLGGNPANAADYLKQCVNSRLSGGGRIFERLVASYQPDGSFTMNGAQEVVALIEGQVSQLISVLSSPYVTCS